MRFSTIFVYLALAVGLAIASPLADRDTGPTLTDVGNSTQPNPEDPKGQESPSQARPEDEIAIVGKRGTTSKREDYNTLDKRGPITLCLYAHKNCRRPSHCYNIDIYKFNMCYLVPRYYSLYLISHPPPPYIYAGYHCIGTFFTRSPTHLFGTLLPYIFSHSCSPPPVL